MSIKNKKNFCFKVLSTKQYLMVSVDKYSGQNYSIPLTTFYFWPREDGWQLMKADLDSKPWLTNELRIEILNGFVELINAWINDPKNKNVLKQKSSTLNFEILGSIQ